MIVITVEMWPKANEKKKWRLGRAYVWNKGYSEGLSLNCNYGVAVRRKNTHDPDHTKPIDSVENKRGTLRTGEVLNYPRERLNMWRLIIRALLSAFPEEAKK